MNFFFEARPIGEAFWLNAYLLLQVCAVLALLIPLGFLMERMAPKYRKVVVSALGAMLLAGVFVGTATAADGTPCVVCTLDGIFNLISCFMWWC